MKYYNNHLYIEVNIKETMNKTINKTINGLLSWSIYSLVACILLGIAEPDLTVRQYIGYSSMFGLLIGSINNLERVIRELQNKD